MFGAYVKKDCRWSWAGKDRKFWMKIWWNSDLGIRVVALASTTNMETAKMFSRISPHLRPIQRTLTCFVMGSVNVRLTSCLTGLDSATQVNMLLIVHKQSRRVQSKQTGGQMYSDASPCSLANPSNISASKIMASLLASHPKTTNEKTGQNRFRLGTMQIFLGAIQWEFSPYNHGFNSSSDNVVIFMYNLFGKVPP